MFVSTWGRVGVWEPTTGIVGNNVMLERGDGGGWKGGWDAKGEGRGEGICEGLGEVGKAVIAADGRIRRAA